MRQNDEWLRTFEEVAGRIKDFIKTNVKVDIDPPSTAAASASYPPLAAYYDADGFHIAAELPGMTKQEIAISLTSDDEVEISGNKRDAVDSNRAVIQANDRYVGGFSRRVNLPKRLELDTTSITASYTDGVLRIHVPRQAASRKAGTTITIE
ncbi:MAG: Hsp20/alpha crystallin family protein [Armatimonadetes bacterium]|nr:Hsp20/alpha crystallin family protein [Armatimonadota bacterium]